jgi:predicted nucleic acid-binding protein
MLIALDTNVLVYGAGLNDESRIHAASQVVSALPAESIVVPAQVLAELFRVLVMRGKWSPIEAKLEILRLTDSFIVADTSLAVMLRATDLAVAHGLQIFDAIILASAAEAGCRLLLSEDMHDGFVWAGVTIANPFLDKRQPILEKALNSTSWRTI